MNDPLDARAVRVLGALMEKQVTTPDNYPLTVNALVSACNQSSNRDPVMALDEAEVTECLKDLAGRSLVREVYRSDSRAKRYRHLMEETMHLHPPEVAAMCVLMLRGEQTVGEIRTRSSRLFDFPDLAHVGVTLQSLMSLDPPLVAELPRQPGQKEARYVHLLSGPPEPGAPADSPPEPVEPDRISALEETVDSLARELEELRSQFESFRGQFQ